MNRTWHGTVTRFGRAENRMAFSLDKFVSIRPFLFHLTFSENLDSIFSTRRLFPAAHFKDGSSENSWLNCRRNNHKPLQTAHGKVYIRDQNPLKEGHIAWDSDWNMPRFVRHLNEHVFFWPGGPEGPIHYGQKHLDRYKSEQPVILKISTESLFQSTSKSKPLFCPWNSGAPRISKGKKCPRGGRTFLQAKDAGYSAGKVAEVVFRGDVGLPYSFEYLDCRDGIWRVDYASCIVFDEKESA